MILDGIQIRDTLHLLTERLRAALHAIHQGDSSGAHHHLDQALQMLGQPPALIQQSAAPIAPAGYLLVPQAARLREVERLVILAALRRHLGNKTTTAKALGMSRRALLTNLDRLRQEMPETDADRRYIEALNEQFARGRLC